MRDLADLLDARTRRPDAIAAAAAARRRPKSLFGPHGRLMIIAADHPARGALRAGADPLAMANRVELLDRIRTGGLAGTAFDIDDPFTAYDAQSIAGAGYEGGKMLLRIDPDDAGTVTTLQSCGTAVSELAALARMAMVEPFISHRVDGRVRNDLSAEAMIRAMTVAAGLGTTSAYSWLKVPVVRDMDRVMAATTLPALILGGEVAGDADAARAAYARWSEALRLPTVQGLVIGRSLLYPPSGSVSDAVDRAVDLL